MVVEGELAAGGLCAAPSRAYSNDVMEAGAIENTAQMRTRERCFLFIGISVYLSLDFVVPTRSFTGNHATTFECTKNLWSSHPLKVAS